MIDTALASFLEEGIAIELGTRNERLEPHGTRVAAAAVDADGLHVVVYVPEPIVPGVLDDLESNGHAAIVFARPPDERACQLKGQLAGLRRATDDERPLVQAQWDRWLDRLATIGFARAAFAHWPVWPCLAIRVRVHAIFNQTPGPGAGNRLA